MPAATAGVTTDDLLNCARPEGVADLFARLGYPVDLVGAEYLRPSGEDGSFIEAWQLAQLGPNAGLRVYLLHVDRLDAGLLRAYASRIQRRYPQVSLLLVVTADWRRLAFINVRPIYADGARMAVKVHRVAIDRQRPTRPDLDLLNRLAIGSHDPEAAFRRHCDAFNVDRVTQGFYREYKALFDRFLAALETQEWAIAEAVRRRTGRQESLHAFAIRLMGRVMFLYFLQKKGWLAGDLTFLERRYAECVGNSGLYYTDVLEPLFFRYLATPEGRQSPWGRIPYLNGGLFTREYDESLVLYVPNELFDPDPNRPLQQRGLLGFFGGYNFTVEEDTPLDVQVALDPELLGKVFENLMEERERGKSGTFYTPRPIVNFMVRESIAHHLEATSRPRVSRERLLALLDDEQWEQASLTKDEARDVEKKALATRILDPAVGTGAFLVSALQHLSQVVRACEHRLGADIRPGTTAMAELKRRIIRDCLFGVDIKPGAIELAQLRLWLSLVLDLNPDEDPDPLPNLEFQIMAGNSLIDSIEGVRLAPQGRPAGATAAQLGLLGSTVQLGLLPADSSLKRIADLKRQFYQAADRPPVEREELRRRIHADEVALLRSHWADAAKQAQDRVLAIGELARQAGGLSHKLTMDLQRHARQAEIYQRAARAVAEGDLTTRPFVYELEFAGVSDQGGFDIVIANPPYVSVQGSSDLSYRQELPRRYVERVNGSERGWVDDLYVHFVFRAFELARTGGVVCFITSDTYFTIQSKRRMRQLLYGRDLRLVAPCDPFRATVDAAIFLALNRPRLSQPECEFDQMRYVSDDAFDRLALEPEWGPGASLTLNDVPFSAREWLDGKLRRYRFDPVLWLGTERAAIWEPSQQNAALYERLILPAEPLLRQWWDKIKTSEDYRKNRAEIEAYLRTLKPGDITLVGLIADGGQGLATANNGRFLAYREDTPQGQKIIQARRAHIQEWEANRKVGPLWQSCLAEANGDEGRAIDLLLTHLANDKNGLGLGRAELYKTIRPDQCVESNELENMPEKELNSIRYSGLKDPVRCWAPFRKGDSEGRRWWAEEPLYIDWSEQSVSWLQEHAHRREPSSPRWQNPHMFFLPGVTWNPIGRDVVLKARLVPACVASHKAMAILPTRKPADLNLLLALLNAPVASYVTKEFINSTNYELNDIRQIPLMIPTQVQETELAREVAARVEECKLGGHDETGTSGDLVADILGVGGCAPFEITH